MSIDFNNDQKKREEDNFFAEFDKISDDFKKTAPQPELQQEEDLSPLQQRRKTRSERLAQQKSESPLGVFQQRAKDAWDKTAGTVISRFTPKDSSKTGDEMTDKSKAKKKKRKYRVNFKKLILACLILMIVVGIGGLAYVYSVIKNAPPIDVDNIGSLLTENSTIYDDQGVVLDNLYNSSDGKRTNIAYDDLPADLRNAFIAIEDKTFWDHKGFNVIRIFGAIKDGILSGGKISGTSTITQQLARNLFLIETRSDYDLTRKILEAYYAVQLEKHMTKKEILEAYLNRISLGFSTSGVQAAAQAYFSKDVGELTLSESVALAALPQAPGAFALVRTYPNEDVEDGNVDLIYRDSTYAYLYNDKASEDRRKLILRFMKEQEYIDETQYETALAENLRDYINPSRTSASSNASYFVDFAIARVMDDLMAEYSLDEEEARNMIYNNGLHIYTTVNTSMQKAVETEFSNNANFPRVENLKKDGAGNILKGNGDILLFNYNNYFDANGTFTLSPNEYKNLPDGGLMIYKGGRLNFYKTEVQGVTDYSVEFRSMYTVVDGIFYRIEKGYISIPQEYKNRDGDGNLIISGKFFEDKPDFFSASDAGLSVSNANYTLKQLEVQPQSAMVITDYKTGQIKSIVGGRNAVGRLLLNRAINPRQPGSSIKPMGVYGPALQSALDALNGGTTQNFQTNDNSGNPVANMYGNFWTPASVIDDAPMVLGGKQWPKNYYSGFRGLYSLRGAVENSVNVCAVKVFAQVGPEYSSKFLEKLGVSSLVKEGNVNDMNAAALALGGMAHGISPLEMASAYGTFPNQGLYVEPTAYIKVTNRKGEILLDNTTPRQTQVMDPGVAWLMTDIMRTTVTSGLGAPAAIGSQPVAGKTGTTTDKYDAWFVGVTPQYAASLWIGNDVGIGLTEGSTAAAKLWSKIMKQVCAGLPAGSFPGAPSNITSATVDRFSGMLPSDISALDPRGAVVSEYFLVGTEPTETDTLHTFVDVCGDSGYLATPACPIITTSFGVQRPYMPGAVGDIAYEVPHYYCNLHNPDTVVYPINPAGSDPYTWDGRQITKDPPVPTEGAIDPGDGTDVPPEDGNPETPGQIIDSQTPEDPEDTLPEWLKQ